MALCATDFWYWATNYVYVLDANDQGESIIRFKKWRHLRELYRLSLRHKMLLVLKSRQIGVSWLWAAIALWETLFHEGRVVAIFSKNQVSSAEMKDRAKFIWQHLPDWQRLPHGKDNDEVLEFPQNNSKIQSFPATEDAGRMSTASLVIIDEWAFHKYAYKNWGAIRPIVEHGRMIGISTADGKNNLFYELWARAKQGENDFLPVFISWKARPGRTQEWWEKEKRNLGNLLALQEYPLYESDAFLIAGDCFFDVDQLHSQPVAAPLRRLGDAKIWFEPEEAGKRLVAAVDTALGGAKNKGDFSVLQMLNRNTGEQVAVLRSRKPIEEWIVDAAELLEMYGSPPVIIEEQPQGMLVAKMLKDRQYPRIWHRSKDRPVWHTGPGNRNELLGDLAMDVRISDPEKGEGVILHDEETVNECLGFAYNEEKHRFEASTGHDDTVMSLALADHLRKDKAWMPVKEEGTAYVHGLWKSQRQRRSRRDVDWSDPDTGRRAA